MPYQRISPYICLLILTIVIYSNSFTSPWLLDDLPNIVNNAPLHIDNLMPETLWQTFFAKPFRQGHLYRPVACLSIALNWYVGQDNTIGYHIVNTVIHVLTAFFLYLAMWRLFQTPRLKETQSPSSIHFIALLAATLWAVNPVQTQAVTYIVQRMASLAGMFTIVSIYAYLRGRLCSPSWRQYRFYGVCIVSFFLALGSKENAVMLPLSLWLIEYIFFDRIQNSDRQCFTILSLVSVSILLAGVVYLYKSGLLTNFFQASGSRPFSPYERVFTESRILFFYLGLIFYPIPSRLSIDHDFTISTSIFDPWTTALSIPGILLLIFLAFRYRRRTPLLSFALLFFFANHVIESTIIPLELIFEHRNYIPSFFLFLPISAWLHALIAAYSKKSKVIYGSLVLFVILIIASIGMGTYIRNMAYATKESFWRDALSKAPHSARALSNLGIDAGWHKGKSIDRLKEALFLNYQALNGYLQRRTYKPSILMNIGNLYFNYGYYDLAVEAYQKALALNPRFSDARYHLAKTYIKQRKFAAARDQIERVIKTNPPNSLFFNVHGLACLWLGEPDAALLSFRKAMFMRRDKRDAYYHVGVALSLAGYYKQAEWFLVKARSRERNNIRIAFSVLENSIRANDPEGIEQNTTYLFSRFDMASINHAIRLLPDELSSVPVDVNLIEPVIASTAEQMSIQLFKN